MSNPEFTKTILTSMHQVLKPLGFRKWGSTFTKRVNEDVVLVINLQKSVWSSQDQVKATVHLGVFSLPLARELARRGHWVRTLDTPTEADCHWQERIGFLL